MRLHSAFFLELTGAQPSRWLLSASGTLAIGTHASGMLTPGAGQSTPEACVPGWDAIAFFWKWFGF